mmetsp:Transcript_5076/g.7681  ORF Transcript_5076/g.7681 Transcript_5076/m.7681 type:complete len:83 (+) Transcript_5076:1740-1988(+)
MACIKIQKYLRGYIEAKKYEKKFIEMRFDDNIEYFKKMYIDMFEPAQIKIAYYWRKKLKRMHKKKAKSKRYRLNSKREKAKD